MHSTLIVGVSQLCGVQQRAPPIFGRATITLGIDPDSSFILFVFNCHLLVNKDDRNVTVADAVLLTGVSVTCTRLWSVRHVFTLPSSG